MASSQPPEKRPEMTVKRPTLAERRETTRGTLVVVLFGFYFVMAMALLVSYLFGLIPQTELSIVGTVFLVPVHTMATLALGYYFGRQQGK